MVEQTNEAIFSNCGKERGVEKRLSLVEFKHMSLIMIFW